MYSSRADPRSHMCYVCITYVWYLRQEHATAFTVWDPNKTQGTWATDRGIVGECEEPPRVVGNGKYEANVAARGKNEGNQAAEEKPIRTYLFL